MTDYNSEFAFHDISQEERNIRLHYQQSLMFLIKAHMTDLTAQGCPHETTATALMNAMIASLFSMARDNSAGDPEAIRHLGRFFHRLVDYMEDYALGLMAATAEGTETVQ